MLLVSKKKNMLHSWDAVLLVTIYRPLHVYTNANTCTGTCSNETVRGDVSSDIRGTSI